ncbi:MAG: class I SAM-dependent methyltransferase, partial [Desulforhabdus sp.]|nr:class I SAM-dependent methyltransferase [Desulforhabdus sp.]
GEWLELCKESNLIASGVDINRSMVEELQQMGLEVIEEDFVSYLRDKNPNTFGAITVFHLIEHLTLENLIILLDEALRVLKPNGVLILETPNPDNIIVGSRSFYIDPTHVKPIPSPTLQYLAEARGYVNIEILNLNPVPEYEREEGITGKLGELLYGARDYSLIGYKP